MHNKSNKDASTAILCYNEDLDTSVFMSRPTVKYLEVSTDDAGMRIDNFILKYEKGVPKTRIYKAIRTGEIRIDKKRAKAFAKLTAGQHIRLPPWSKPEDKEINITTNPLPSWIVYEDEQIIAINKPEGIAVHAGTKQDYGLVDLASDYFGQKCYLVHRLDKAVSGIILLTKNRNACKTILEKWHDIACHKSYQAVVFTNQLKPCVIDKPLPDKASMAHKDKNCQSAVTHIQPLASVNSLTWTNITIKTGRYHQIRRHLALVNMPIVGDCRYGHFDKNRAYTKEHKIKGLWLHAQSITFFHPKGTWQTIKANWPKEKNKWLVSFFEGKINE